MPVQAETGLMGPNPWIASPEEQLNIRRLTARRKQVEAVFGAGAQLDSSFTGDIRDVTPPVAPGPETRNVSETYNLLERGALPQQIQSIQDVEAARQAGGLMGAYRRVAASPKWAAKYVEAGNLHKQKLLAQTWNAVTPVEDLAHVGETIGANVSQGEKGFDIQLPDGRRATLSLDALDRLYKAKRVEQIKRMDPLMLGVSQGMPQLPTIAPKVKYQAIPGAPGWMVNPENPQDVQRSPASEEMLRTIEETARARHLATVPGFVDVTGPNGEHTRYKQEPKSGDVDLSSGQVLRKGTPPASIGRHFDAATGKETTFVTDVNPDTGKMETVLAGGSVQVADPQDPAWQHPIVVKDIDPKTGKLAYYWTTPNGTERKQIKGTPVGQEKDGAWTPHLLTVPTGRPELPSAVEIADAKTKGLPAPQPKLATDINGNPETEKVPYFMRTGGDGLPEFMVPGSHPLAKKVSEILSGMGRPASPSIGGAPSAASALPPIADRVVGQTYPSPNGNTLIWRGTGWEHAPTSGAQGSSGAVGETGQGGTPPMPVRSETAPTGDPVIDTARHSLATTQLLSAKLEANKKQYLKDTIAVRDPQQPVEVRQAAAQRMNLSAREEDQLASEALAASTAALNALREWRVRQQNEIATAQAQKVG